MKVIKKILCFVIALTLCLSLTECGGSNKTEKKQYKLKVMTTLFPYYDFARAVIGDIDDIDLQLLVSPGQDDHSFEPTPKDVVAINQADLFIYNGGSIENWVDTVIDSLDNKKQQQMRMMDAIGQERLLGEEEEEGVFAVSDHDHEHEDSHSHSQDEKATDDYEDSHSHTKDETDEHSQAGSTSEQEEHSHADEELDEHIWTSPANAEILVDSICQKLSQMMPEHKVQFRKNADNYIKQIKQLDTKFKNITSKATHKEVIFADKFPIKYFAKEYGLKYYAAFAGCSGDTEPSAKTVAFLIDKVKKNDVKGIFYLELSSTAMADTICQDTGTVAYQFNSCHNITNEQFKAGVTYVQLMKENAKILEKALN